VQVVVW